MHYFDNISAASTASVTLVIMIILKKKKKEQKKLGIYNYSEELFAVPQGNGKDLQTISPQKIILSRNPSANELETPK